MDDPRRGVPRTDRLLALPGVVDARSRLNEAAIRVVVTRQQQAVREGRLAADDIEAAIERELAATQPSTIRPVLNATGVIVHTNLGRAPLSATAIAAIEQAARYSDLELDLRSGKRGSRGRGAVDALLEACPAAEAALVVNNGAAALLLAVTALSGTSEIVVSRGELIEIGAGFRLPELMEVFGSRLREVGATNRTHPADYARVLGDATGCVLKVHPSNFTISGFTSGVDVATLRQLLDEHAGHIPLVVDLGSGSGLTAIASMRAGASHVLAADVDGIRVATGEGALVLTELQRAGGKRLAAADFLRGFPLAAGQVLDAAPPTKAAG